MTHVFGRFARLAFALALVVSSAAATAGCSSPLASRRAQAMEPGELEVSLVPYVEGTTVVAGGVPFAPLAYPFIEASARVGLVDRLDLQVKVDPTVIPEVSLAYQIVGDPSKNELAFTLGAGVKPTVFAVPGVAAGLVTVPVQAIVDVPLGTNLTAVAGARVIPAVLFGGAIGVAGTSAFTVAPGGFLALHIDAGPFFIRPELAMNGVVPLFATNGASASPFLGAAAGTINVAAGLGIGGVIDFRKKSPAPLPDAPVDAPIDAPVDAPAPAPAPRRAPVEPSDPAGDPAEPAPEPAAAPLPSPV